MTIFIDRNRRQFRAGALVALVTATVLLAAVGDLLACSVPVFRYALERWQPDPYEAVVFHRGPLAKDDAAAVAWLRERATDSQAPANISVKTVDLAANPPADMAALYESCDASQLPCLAICYPAGIAFRNAIWSGRLSRETARAAVESPLRREIAKGLLGGDSAVWVLLESGDAAKDAAAASLLTMRLEKLQQALTLQLPEPEADSPDADAAVQSAVPLKIAFSVIRMPKGAGEEPLRAMLLHSEADLPQYANEPMAFPIYGRGRILYSLVGKGISAENVREACTFLTGPCSCQAKMDNPGTDLLVSANWNGAVLRALTVDKVLPPLTGVMPVGEEKRPAPAQPRAQQDAPFGSPKKLLTSVAAAMAVAIIAAAVATCILLVRRSRAEGRRR